MKKIFLLLILLSPLAFSAIDERKTDVYFANGIKTERGDASDYSALLEKAIINKIGSDSFSKTIGEVSYAYNSTANIGADLLESLLQKFGWDWLTNLTLVPTLYVGMHMKVA